MCVVFFLCRVTGHVVTSMVRDRAVSQRSKMLRRPAGAMVLLLVVNFLAMGVGTTARSHSQGENYFYY